MRAKCNLKIYIAPAVTTICKDADTKDINAALDSNILLKIGMVVYTKKLKAPKTHTDMTPYSL